MVLRSKPSGTSALCALWPSRNCTSNSGAYNWLGMREGRGGGGWCGAVDSISTVINRVMNYGCVTNTALWADRTGIQWRPRNCAERWLLHCDFAEKRFMNHCNGPSSVSDIFSWDIWLEICACFWDEVMLVLYTGVRIWFDLLMILIRSIYNQQL